MHVVAAGNWWHSNQAMYTMLLEVQDENKLADRKHRRPGSSSCSWLRLWPRVPAWAAAVQLGAAHR
jgi:hypothetical protein